MYVSINNIVFHRPLNFFKEYHGEKNCDSLCPALFNDVRRKKSPVKTDELIGLIRQRRSIRVFLDVPLTENEKIMISEVAQHAPSSCNRQAVDLIFVADPELKQFVASTIAGGKQFLHNAPCIIVFVSAQEIIDFLQIVRLRLLTLLRQFKIFIFFVKQWTWAVIEGHIPVLAIFTLKIRSENL